MRSHVLQRLLRQLVPLVSVALFATPAVLQSQDILVRDGYEAFPMVDYQGGDARFKKKGTGVLVLTDSTLAFYNCSWGYCEDHKGRMFEPKGLIWSVPLNKITSVSVSSQNRGASVTGRVLFGALATDSNAEYFAFAHDTETSAEAPVFRTPKTMSGALDAKVRFKLRKLGINLPQ